MLEYAKTILEKVSFDALLFSKELKKALRILSSMEEVEKLRSWCYQKFKTSSELTHILDECFFVAC